MNDIAIIIVYLYALFFINCHWTVKTEKYQIIFLLLHSSSHREESYTYVYKIIAFKSKLQYSTYFSMAGMIIHLYLTFTHNVWLYPDYFILKFTTCLFIVFRVIHYIGDLPLILNQKPIKNWTEIRKPSIFTLIIYM